MIVTAWRIVKKKHQAAAFSGEGARRYGGRWNSKGVAMVYAAASSALAALEILVHLQAHEILRSYVLMSISFDDILVETLPVSELPRQWRSDPAPAALQAIGDQWITRASSAVLRVPSVLIDNESNYLLNPNHSDFARCVRGKPRPFRFDRRLLK